jgi:hypothetical protein
MESFRVFRKFSDDKIPKLISYLCYRHLMARYYLDTSIWLDLFENRNELRLPKSDYAESFIAKVISESEKIVYSDAVIEEKIRGWFMVAISLCGLIVLIFGACQIQEVNVNLGKISSEEVSTQKLIITSENGSERFSIRSNETHTSMG